MKYEIEITGYGGEIVMGKLTKEQYDFWIDSLLIERFPEELTAYFGIPEEEDGNPTTDVDEDPDGLDTVRDR